MARRGETDKERQARARLRQRHDAEVRAYGAFFDVAERRAQMQAELDRLDEEEAAAIATLATLLDAATVAELVGWSTTKVRSAAKLADTGTDDGTREDRVHTAAEVAG